MAIIGRMVALSFQIYLTINIKHINGLEKKPSIKHININFTVYTWMLPCIITLYSTNRSSKMKDYINHPPKRRHDDKQIPKLWEVIVMMLIGCTFGMLTLAWMGLL